ncbi:MAG TPA: glycosyltransferase [Pseudonocardiaceae bacterium]|jgi:hopene-associated glycosyltransferase HpnB|nr:glycosyltransferase [Pseudonocardiaceae bacterium]
MMIVLAVLALFAWGYLLVGHGGYWRTGHRLPDLPSPGTDWPSVVAVVPARNEATMLASTLPALLAQDYPGEFRVVLVDDASTDGTEDVARSVATPALSIVPGEGPPPGWAGKVAAMAAGVAEAGEPTYLLFTDADIGHPPDSVRALVAAAQTARLDLVSLMVRLGTATAWERLVVPAFVYFFAQLYPFRRVSNPKSRTAAAAGGCMLVRRAALVAAGGLACIRGALIDDVALGTLLKRRPGGGRTWLGFTDEVASRRPYPRLADLWDMVARSAYTQLRYSPALLLGTIVGLLVLYVVPVVATVLGAVGLGSWWLFGFGLAAWLMMSASYLPVLRLYRLGPWRAPLLPAVALLYAAMTVDSARRHWLGRGGAWKGRTASRTTAGG